MQHNTQLPHKPQPFRFKLYKELKDVNMMLTIIVLVESLLVVVLMFFGALILGLLSPKNKYKYPDCQ